MPFIEAENIEYSYPGGSVSALRGISLKIERGEYVALVGSNGSGKSTLALHLNGLLIPSGGSLRVAGLDSRAASNLPRIRQYVAVVFQRPEEQVVGTTVEEDTAFGPENLGLPRAEIRARVDRALEFSGLAGLKDRSPHELSGGQKQRLAIAGALALEPECLVLDEATSMLDPAGRRELLAFLAMLNSTGITVVHITHRMEEAAQAKRVIALHRGKIVADDGALALFARPEIVSWGLTRPAALSLSLMLSAEYGIPIEPCMDFPALAKAIVRGVARKTAPALPKDAPANLDGGSPQVPSRVQEDAPIVALHNVSHSYVSSGATIPTLHSVTLAIHPGETIALIGPTGSGKSTLLQHLNALFIPRDGCLEVFGEKVTPNSTDLPSVRRSIGLGFQRPEEQLFEQFVGDEVAYGPRLAGTVGRGLTAAVRSAMEQAGLPFDLFKDRLTFALSGGEQRKVGLADIIALSPALLALDEPTAGLDPVSRTATHDLLRRLVSSGTGLILATHDMDEALLLAGRICLIAEGRVVFDAPARELPGWATELDEHGLALPGPIQLLARLREAGLEVPRFVKGIDECAAAVAGLYGSEAVFGAPAVSTALAEGTAPARRASLPRAPVLPPQRASGRARANTQGRRPRREARQFDLTRGMDFARFVPGPSPIHLLHPGSKIVLVVAALAAFILFPGPVGLAACFALANLGLLASRSQAAVHYRSIARILPLLVVIALLQVLTVPTFHWGSRLGTGVFSLYSGELFAGVTSLLRFVDFILLLSVMASVTRPSELSYAAESLTSPLAPIGFPSSAISLIITVAFYFLPLFGIEASRILKSQASRGADFATRGLGLVRRIRTYLPIFVPLMVLALRHAENLAQAMEARCYIAERRRTRLHEHRIAARDVVAVAAAAGLVAAALINPFHAIDDQVRSFVMLRL